MCLGSAGEIGASSHYLRAGGVGLLLDAGLHPKREGTAALPRFRSVDDEVDHILITHSHLDHVGALPRAVAAFPRARVHMTHATARFAFRMLRNAANVMRRRRERDPAAYPLYDFDTVSDLESLVETHEENEPVRLGRGPVVTFVSAGHIPGAAGLLIEEQQPHRRFFFTGDTCGSAQLLVPGARYPGGPIDVLLTETTYGGNLVADGFRREDVTKGFAAALARVLGRGGVAMVPVFALGRAQELLFQLSILRTKGRLPSVPIYLTGLARALTRVYDETRRDTPRRDPELRLEQLDFEVLDDDALAAGGPEGPAIVLASSGMLLPQTISNKLARRVLPDAGAAIFIVGYQDPDSPGFRVQHGQPGEAIDLGDGAAPVERRCEVERFHFRAHSSRGELLAAARQMRPHTTVVVHGDAASSDSLGTTIEGEGGRVLRPEPAVAYDL